MMVASSRKEREKEQRKASILDAAMRVFKRKGIQAASMDEIAKEAEFSKGTLYSYFDSKFALFAELSNRVLSQVLNGFIEISKQDCQGRPMIVQMLNLWETIASSNIRQFRLAMSWIASDESPDWESEGAACHRDSVKQIIGHLAAAIVRGKADGSICRAGQPEVIACQLWSGMMGALLFSSRGDECPVPVIGEGFMKEFVELLTAGLGVES